MQDNSQEEQSNQNLQETSRDLDITGVSDNNLELFYQISFENPQDSSAITSINELNTPSNIPLRTAPDAPGTSSLPGGGLNGQSLQDNRQQGNENLPRSSQEATTLPDISDLDFNILLNAPFRNEQNSSQINSIQGMKATTPIPLQTGSNSQVEVLLPAQGPSLFDQANFSLAAGSYSNSTTANSQSYTVSNVSKNISTEQQFEQLLIQLGYEPKHYQSVAARGNPPLLKAYPSENYNSFEELHHQLLSQGFTREHIANLACRSQGRERLKELVDTGFDSECKLIGSEEFRAFLREKRLEFNAEQVVKVIATSTPKPYTYLTALYKHTKSLIDYRFTVDQIISMLAVTSGYGTGNLSCALKYFDDFEKLNFDGKEKNNPQFITAKLAKILSYAQGTERLKLFIRTYNALRRYVSDSTIVDAISKEKGKAALELLCTQYNINPQLPSAPVQAGGDDRNLAIGSSQRDHLVEGQEVITNRGQFEQLLIKLGYPKSLYNFPIGMTNSTMLAAYKSDGYNDFAMLHHQLVARGFTHEEIATVACRRYGQQRLQVLLNTGYDIQSKLIGSDDFKSFLRIRRLEVRKDQLIQVIAKSSPEVSTYIDALYEHTHALIEKGFTLEQVLHMLAAIQTGHINLASALEYFDDFKKLNLKGTNNEQAFTGDLANILHFQYAGKTIKLLLQTHSELKKYCSYEEIMKTIVNDKGKSRLKALCAKHGIDTEKLAGHRRGNKQQTTAKNKSQKFSASAQAPNASMSDTTQSRSTNSESNSPGFIPFPSNSPELQALLGLSPELPNANQMSINSAVNAEAATSASGQPVQRNLEDLPAYKKCLDSQGNIISHLKYFTKEQLLAVAGQEDGEKRIDLLIYVAWQFVSKKFPPAEIIKLAMHKNYAQTLRVSRQDYTAEFVESRLKAVDNLGNQELSRQPNNIAFHAALMPSSTRPESDFERARVLSLQDSAHELPQINYVPVPLNANQPRSNARDDTLVASTMNSTQSPFPSIYQTPLAISTHDRVVAERPEANTISNSLALYSSPIIEGGLFSRPIEQYNTLENYPAISFSDLTLNPEPTAVPAGNIESFFNQPLSPHVAVTQPLAFKPTRHPLMTASQLLPLEAILPMQKVATTTVVNQLPQQTESHPAPNSQVILATTIVPPQNRYGGEMGSESLSDEYQNRQNDKGAMNTSKSATAACITGDRPAKRSREESQDKTSYLRSDHEQLLIKLGYTEKDYKNCFGRNKCSLLDVLYQSEFNNFKDLHIALSSKGFTCVEIAQIATLADGTHRLKCIIESGFDNKIGLLGPEGSSFRKALHERGLRFSKEQISEIVMKQLNGNRHKENNLAGVINYGCALITEGFSAQQIVQIAAKQGGTHNLKAASEKFAQLQALTYLKEESANKAKIIERMISIVGHRDGHERLNKFIQIYDSLRAKGYPDKDIMAAFDKDKFNLEQELKSLDSKYGQGSKTATTFSRERNQQQEQSETSQAAANQARNSPKEFSTATIIEALNSSKPSSNGVVHIAPSFSRSEQVVDNFSLPALSITKVKTREEKQGNLETPKDNKEPVRTSQDFENLLNNLGYTEQLLKALKTLDGKIIRPSIIEAFPKSGYEKFESWHHALIAQGFKHEDLAKIASDNQGDKKLEKVATLYNAKTGLIGNPESKIFIYMDTHKLKLRIDQVVDLLGQPGGHNNLDGIIAYIVPLTTKGFNLDDLVEIASHTNGHKNLKAANDYFEAVKNINLPIDKKETAQIIARIKTIVAHDSGLKFLKRFINLYNEARQGDDEEVMNASHHLEELWVKYKIQMGESTHETGSSGKEGASSFVTADGKHTTKRKESPVTSEELNAEIRATPSSKKSSTLNMMQKLNVGKNHADSNSNTEISSSSSVSKNREVYQINGGKAAVVSAACPDEDRMSSQDPSQLLQK